MLSHTRSPRMHLTVGVILASVASFGVIKWLRAAATPDVQQGARVVERQGLQKTAADHEDRIVRLEATMKALERRLEEQHPPVVGTIASYAGPVDERRAALLEKAGWLVCDGKERSRAAFPQLADVIQDSWGKAKNSGDFKLPDLRGQFLRGVNDTAKDDEGDSFDPEGEKRKIGSRQRDQIRDHLHVLNGLASAYVFANIPSQPPTAGAPTVGGFLGTGPGIDPGAAGSPFGFVYASSIVMPGSAGPHSHTQADAKETRPKNSAVYWIIRAR